MTPYGSPAKRDKTRDRGKEREMAAKVLASLLEHNDQEMTPFRILYNLEVLSGRILPEPLQECGGAASSLAFCDEFLACGGLQRVNN